MLIEGVHFKSRGIEACRIGHKALARNLSDIAAMGGVPKYAVVSIGLRPGLGLSFVDGISKGILSLAKKFGVNIVGGDTCRSDRLVIDISLIGEVRKKDLLLRSGAKIGDLIFVTGSIGGSRKGKHLDFIPRLDESRQLVSNFKINSMIDVSDGLLLDLWRVMDASGVGSRIYELLIPLSKGAGTFDKAIEEGEDFELLFTMSPKEAMKAAKLKLKTPVSLIGQVIDKRERFRLVDRTGKEKLLKPKGFLHF